jgi:hypothetical protein
MLGVFHFPGTRELIVATHAVISKSKQRLLQVDKIPARR